MTAFSIKEFRPTILFLAKFLGIYLLSNLLYGWYVTAWYPKPDPVTHWVSNNSVALLNVLRWETVTQDSPAKPTTLILFESKAVLAVYEGCNGVNTAIVFLSFVFAFGPLGKRLAWFAPLGLVVIHISNLARIVLLFIVTMYLPNYLYFTHKYLFTAFIYLFVFLMWVWWVAKLSKPTQHGS